MKKSILTLMLFCTLYIVADQYYEWIDLEIKYVDTKEKSYSITVNKDSNYKLSSVNLELERKNCKIPPRFFSHLTALQIENIALYWSNWQSIAGEMSPMLTLGEQSKGSSGTSCHSLFTYFIFNEDYELTVVRIPELLQKAKKQVVIIPVTEVYVDGSLDKDKQVYSNDIKARELLRQQTDQDQNDFE